MNAAPALLVAGLTGGIACGKSTVDTMFASMGAQIIDADLIVHDLLAPGGEGVDRVIGTFGQAVAGQGGGVDRRALGAIVFRDAAARARLEAILHPMVSRRIAVEVDRLRGSPGSGIVIVDAALLVESGLDGDFDSLIVVSCSEGTQVARLRDSRGMTEDEALVRIRAQAPADVKAARADYRIDNDGAIERTRAQVTQVYASLLADLENLRSGSSRPSPPSWRRPGAAVVVSAPSQGPGGPGTPGSQGSKVRTLDALVAILARERLAGRTIALANGLFDLLHVGHVRYLAAAKREAEILVVGINSDASARALKGPGRPVLPEAERAEIVASLASVDWVFVFDEGNVERALDLLRPDVHCKGTDYTIDTVPEREAVRAYGGRIAIVGDPKDHATRDIIKDIASRFRP